MPTSIMSQQNRKIIAFYQLVSYLTRPMIIYSGRRVIMLMQAEFEWAQCLSLAGCCDVNFSPVVLHDLYINALCPWLLFTCAPLTVHNILRGFLITLQLFCLVLLLNAITECIKKHSQTPAEQSQPPQKPKVRRFKKKMLVEPSIRISLQSPIDSVASGTLDNYGVDSAGFSRPNKDVAKKSSRKIARTVHEKLKHSEPSGRNSGKMHTSLTQKSPTTSQDVMDEHEKRAKQSKNKIKMKEMDESTVPKGSTPEPCNETKGKVPTLDGILGIGKLKSISRKKRRKNMLGQDGRTEKKIEQSTWEGICVSQTAQKLSLKESPLVPNSNKYTPVVTKEVYKEDETEKTEGTLVSDHTQQFSEEHTLSVVEHPNEVLKSNGVKNAISQTELAVEDDREKATVTSTGADSSDRMTRTEAVSVESVISTTKKGTSSSRKDETGPRSSDASRLSSRESTETTRASVTSHRPDHKGSSNSQGLLGLENTQSSHRLIQKQLNGNIKLKQFDESKTQPQKSRSENTYAARAMQCWLRRQPKTSPVGDTQTTQRSQLDTSSSTLHRNLADRRDRNARKFNRTDSTEEDSRSRKPRVPARRIPIKVHPDRLRIPCKRGTQNPPDKPPTSSKGMQE